MNWICTFSLVFFIGACSDILITMRAPKIEDPWLQFLLDFSKRFQQKLTDP